MSRSVGQGATARRRARSQWRRQPLVSPTRIGVFATAGLPSMLTKTPRRNEAGYSPKDGGHAGRAGMSGGDSTMERIRRADDPSYNCRFALQPTRHPCPPTSKKPAAAAPSPSSAILTRARRRLPKSCCCSVARSRCRVDERKHRTAFDITHTLNIAGPGSGSPGGCVPALNTRSRPETTGRPAFPP